MHPKGYDYSQAGAYFVTICIHSRQCLFGDAADGRMALNQAGWLVQQTWEQLPGRFPSVALDTFVVMPNHIHGVIAISGCPVGAGLALPGEPTGAAVQGTASSTPTLGDVIRAFKSVSAIQVNRLLSRSGQPLWQRNYYEHIIREEDDLGRIRQYILDNPVKWPEDTEHPQHLATSQGQN